MPEPINSNTMKMYLRIATVTLLAYLLTACASTSEEVWIQPDGSGRVSFRNDMSMLYPFILMGMEAQLAKDPDSLDESDRKMIAFFNRDQLDTTILFADIFAEAAKEMSPTGMGDLFAEIDRDTSMDASQKSLVKGFLADLSTLELNLRADRGEREFEMITTQFFDEVSAYESFGSGLNELFDLIASETDSLEDDKARMGAQLLGSMLGGSTQYKLDGGTLRVFRPGDEPLDQQEGMDPETAMALAMFGGSDEDYEILIHLPGKIRRVDYPNAEVNKKERTVRVRIPAEDLEEDLEFTIEFKNKRRRGR